MRLNVKAFSLTCGIIWAATVFLATISVVVRGGTGELTCKLGRYYIGYSTTIPGAFVGMIWAFIHLSILGMIFAALYNYLAPKDSHGNKSI
jgi:hypothetical protein